MSSFGRGTPSVRAMLVVFLLIPLAIGAPYRWIDTEINSSGHAGPLANDTAIVRRADNADPQRLASPGSGPPPDIAKPDWMHYMQIGAQLDLWMGMGIDAVTRELRELGQLRGTSSQSTVSTEEELEALGWRKMGGEPPLNQFMTTSEYPIKSALHKNILFEDTEFNSVSTWTRNPPGVEYEDTTRAPDAIFRNVVNARDGAIMAFKNKPGTYRAQGSSPPLQSWSEVVFPMYLADKKHKELKYEDEYINTLQHIFHVEIQDRETQDILAYMLLQDHVRKHGMLSGQPPPTFRGAEMSPALLPVYDKAVELTATNTLWDALIGSPVGQEVAWFLIEHKAQLGMLHVLKIKVFVDDKAARVGGLFKGPSMEFFLNWEGEDTPSSRAPAAAAAGHVSGPR